MSSSAEALAPGDASASQLSSFRHYRHLTLELAVSQFKLRYTRSQMCIRDRIMADLAAASSVAGTGRAAIRRSSRNERRTALAASLGRVPVAIANTPVSVSYTHL